MICRSARNCRNGRWRSAAPRARSPLRRPPTSGSAKQCVVGVGLIDAHAGGLGLLGGFATPELNSRLAMIAGTSTCHMAVSPDARQVPGVWGPYFNAMLPGLWLNEGGQSATGALLDHILDWHAEGRTLAAPRHARVLARIDELHAGEGPAMAHELFVLPDFHGNRSPLADPLSRGAISGLTLDSSFDSLARLYYATAVGIALGTRHVVDVLNAHGYDIRNLHVTGGHVANPLLVRLYADATDCTVELPDEEDSVLLGTAMAAAAAAGLHGSLEAAARAMRHAGRRITPSPETRAHFADRYRKFLLMHEQQRMLRTHEFLRCGQERQHEPASIDAHAQAGQQQKRACELAMKKEGLGRR